MIEPKSTDIGRKLCFKVGDEKKYGTLADFNSTYVHVTVGDAGTIPLPRDMLEWAEEETAPEIAVDAALRAAMPTLARCGLPFKIVDAHRVRLAGVIEAMPCTGSWERVGVTDVPQYGGIDAAIRAARAMVAAAVDNRPSEVIVREDRDAWPDRQGEQLPAEEGEAD